MNSIVHTHGFWNVAQSAFSREPKVWHNMSTFFYKRTAVSPDDTRVPLVERLGLSDVSSSCVMFAANASRSWL